MQNRTLAPDLYHRASQRYIAHARTCRQTTSRNTLALSVQNTASGTRRTTLCAHTPIVTILERFPPRTLTCGLRFGEKLSILALQKPNRALRQHCSFPISISKKGKGELGKKTKKRHFVQSKKVLVLYCSDNTQVEKKVQNISQNVLSIYRYNKKALYLHGTRQEKKEG